MRICYEPLGHNLPLKNWLAREGCPWQPNLSTLVYYWWSYKIWPLNHLPVINDMQFNLSIDQPFPKYDLSRSLVTLLPVRYHTH